MTGAVPTQQPDVGALSARRIDHVGVVVEDMAPAVEHFTGRFGLEPSADWTDPEGRFRLVYLEAGDTTLQLVQPLGPGPLATFLEERGEAIHHVCFAVDDLDEAARAAPGGLQSAPYLGGRGARVCFLAERSHGVIVELTEITR